MHGLKLSRLLAAAFVMVAVAGLLWYRFRPQPVAVLVHTVERGPVARSVSNTRAGSIKSCRRSKLAFHTGGQIEKILVSKGDHVRAGQPLIELWNHDLRATVAVQEEEVNSARMHSREVCARADLSARDAERAGRLFKDQLIAEELYDKVTSESRALAAQCDASRTEIDHSAARLKLSRTQLSQTVLAAPYAGRIGDITGEVGEFTTPSPPGIPTPPAVDLIDDSCYYVSAPVDEIDAGSLRTGMPATVSIDAFQGARFPGHISRIADYVLEMEKQARTVDVEVKFTTPPDRNLLVGYSADIELTPEARSQVLRVPTQAILQNKTVLVFNPETRRLDSRPVSTGLNNWEFTEVTSGLAEGEQVVMSLDRAGVKAGAAAKVERGGAGP